MPTARLARVGLPRIPRPFMQDQLGIDLHSDGLPLSNIPAHLPPFLLSPDRVMTLAGQAPGRP